MASDGSGLVLDRMCMPITRPPWLASIGCLDGGEVCDGGDLVRGGWSRASQSDGALVAMRKDGVYSEQRCMCSVQPSIAVRSAAQRQSCCASGLGEGTRQAGQHHL